MMLCLIALMLYSVWAGVPYYNLMAVFWLYGGIVMFSGYCISKMKSYFVMALLEFAVAAVSVGFYIKSTWPTWLNVATELNLMTADRIKE